MRNEALKKLNLLFCLCFFYSCLAVRPGACFDWFPVNPMKKKEMKKEKKKILIISLKTLFIDFVLVI